MNKYIVCYLEDFNGEWIPVTNSEIFDTVEDAIEFAETKMDNKPSVYKITGGDLVSAGKAVLMSCEYEREILDVE